MSRQTTILKIDGHAEINVLIDLLYRQQSGKIISILTRIFGPENLDLAEDVVNDSFIEAIKHWSNNEVPGNPPAWLYRVAKNKAINVLNREKYRLQYHSDIAHFLQSEWTAEPALNIYFSEKEILDDQLRMMFTCCHPSISRDSQIALTLKTLCGFSITEIAKAFLTTEENIKKRLVRARKEIREDKIPFEIPQGKDLKKRLQTVLETIYLLFNEGYNASSGEDLIRYELCAEAIRLAEIISHHPAMRHEAKVYALLALMQLNASRFKARQDQEGNILTLEKQDRSQWDPGLMESGFSNFEKSSSDQLSMYHILAAISAYHCSAADYKDTSWKSIFDLYNKLLEINNSPVVLLNRAIALSKVCGVEPAIMELERIKNMGFLESYYLFYSVKAEFYIQLDQFKEAIPELKTAIELAPLQKEKVLLVKKLESCFEKKV